LIEIRSLEGVPYETLTAAFNDSFSDYAVPANWPVEYLKSVLIRRGFRPDVAVGAFDGDRLVGFVFNALHGDNAYNSGTGVVISHRRQGIARDLMQRSIETLPAKRYVLEVIETNEKAAALYRSLGFEETRRLQCWSWAGVVEDSRPRLSNLHHIRTFCDVSPSWQNETHSILRANEPYVVVGDDDGGAIVFPSNGDVPQLAVRKEARRRGLGRNLLHAAAAQTKAPLRIMNIDDGDKGIATFLEKCNARRTVRQIEMHREL
jgi:ribosomal protein S18 acetylase RimI-like enzyme